MFDVGIVEVTGQIIPQNRAFHVEPEFALKDDGDMVFMDNEVELTNCATFGI